MVIIWCTFEPHMVKCYWRYLRRKKMQNHKKMKKSLSLLIQKKYDAACQENLNPEPDEQLVSIVSVEKMTPPKGILLSKLPKSNTTSSEGLKLDQDLKGNRVTPETPDMPKL